MLPDMSATASLAHRRNHEPPVSRHAQRRIGLDASLDGTGGLYALVREIGRGKRATVYLATDTRHQRQVAIKVLHEDGTPDRVRERFQSEIETMARLRHPNILPIYDSGECGGHLFYVTPFVTGGTLEERLVEGGALPPCEAIRLTGEVGDALAEVHRSRMVHLDIKPANVLMDHGHAVLSDFGIARRVFGANGACSGTSPRGAGTPCYMSPEQLVTGRVDGRADVYALGCLAFEMLAGAPPFDDPCGRTVRARQLLAPVPSVRDAGAPVSCTVDRALQTALAKDPVDRFDTVGAFVEALSEECADE